MIFHWQAESVMYIDTEKKFSSRRIVEMAKSRWPHTFHNQVLLSQAHYEHGRFLKHYLSLQLELRDLICGSQLHP